MRLNVDGASLIHEDVTSMSAYVRDGDLDAEVQIAERGGAALTVVIAGDVEQRVGQRGELILTVHPTPHTAPAPAKARRR